WGACYDGEIVYGCMDMDACNYNPDANTPDDCTYAEENYDCDGNCIVEIDCYGVCGGDFTPDFECFDGSIVCNPSDCGGGEPITYNVYRDGELLMGWLMDPNYVDSDLGYSEPHCYTVTYNYGAGFESEHSNQACSETDEMVVIPGCMDEDACNYNPDANEDDDTCIHPEENYDCDGNCIPGEDECGICGGDGVEIECWDGEIVCEESDCSDEPDNSPFSFNQSSSQAFYHIFSAYDLDGNSLVAGEDWIGVFSGDVCVGAREWTNDISTDIPAMGDDGYWYSIGYLQEGDYPSFQIFDASENLYYPAHPAEEFAFSNNGTFSVESLSAGINYTLSLNNHHNLVSFYALPEDVSITGVTSDLGNNALSVIAEGSSAINLDGLWSGSLTEFSGENGYWISINNFPDNLSVIGFDMDPDRMYELHEGPNLISFPDSGSADLSSAIPDDVEHLFTAIISEGISALNSDNGWAGSLTGFQGGAGYWVIVQEDLTFSYNTEDLLSRSVHSFLEKLPDEAGFTVAQSSRQAFYFVNSIKLDNGSVEDGDWILSYNNDVLAGIRQWKGKSVDIPAMGSANDIVTAGYFNLGDTPAFKLLKQSTGEIIALEGNIPSWSNNGIFSVGELYEKQPIPELFTLNKAYPNPFNPTTTIGFGLPDQSEIMVEIFNLHGKRVEILVDKSMPSGYSSVVWNADKFSSGLYFVKLSAQSFNGIKYTSIQKLMLVK
nr:T9SS type A sorting domain-containing protein [Candidatus Neomarinimicrobiota bacterium]